MIHKVKNLFAIDSEEQKFLPTLHLQILDSDTFSPDSYIGKFCIIRLKTCCIFLIKKLSIGAAKKQLDTQFVSVLGELLNSGQY